MKVSILTVLFFVAAVNCYYGQKAELEGFNIDPKRITLSGFSSGGTFAQHLQFSYSTLFTGIAVFSHSYYRCGPGNGKVLDYDKFCTKEFNLKESEYYNPELVHKDIEQYRRNYQIEDPAKLKNTRLYVYTGIRSFLFTPAMGLSILRVYERYIQNAKNIRTRVQDADLVMPTNKIGVGPCTETSSKSGYTGNCGFSGAYEALNFLLPDKVNQEPTVGTNIQLQTIQTFDQEDYYEGIVNHQLDTTGYLYVPSQCKSGFTRCLLHFYFHGCLVGREFNDTLHIKNSGYLEVAELNNIIMVFPQAKSSLPENKIGCWDTFGVSGPLYATREGPQVRAVKNILDKILNEASSSGSRPTIHDHHNSKSRAY